MRITMNGEPFTLPEGTALSAFLAASSPFGEEETMCLVNGTLFRSVDEDDTVLQEGDVLQIYPLIVGG